MPAFSQAIIPETPTICGFVLRPFCLGHYLILEADENRLICAKTDEWELRDLVFASVICSMTWELASQFIRSVSTGNLITAIPKDPIKEAIAITKYFHDATRPPNTIPGDVARIGAEWTEILLSRLLDKFHNLSDAMNFPIAAGRRLLIADREVATGKRIFSAPLDEDTLEMVRELTGNGTCLDSN